MSRSAVAAGTRDGAADGDVLNLGCGEDYIDGAVNVDVESRVEPDEVVDLNAETWPWGDDTFRVVLANHVLEHLHEPMAALEEIQRIVERDGVVIITYPIGHTRFEDPTHRHYWNYRTAEWLAGGGKHDHENTVQLTLIKREVEWHASTPASAYTHLRAFVSGYGPWLSQVPSLAGEVRARYVVKND